MKNGNIQALCFAGLCSWSSPALAQLWSSVDIVTKADVHAKLGVTKDDSCLSLFSVSHGKHKISVPKEAFGDICRVLLEETKVEPDETAINNGSIAVGFKVVLSILPPAQPDDHVSDDQLIRYEFSFVNDCLASRTKVRKDLARNINVDDDIVTWPCH